MKTQIEVGKVYAVRYPFFMSSYEKWEDDFPTEVQSWRPGCQVDTNQGEDDYLPVRYYYSEGHGEMLLDVVGVFKPGRYPERVFFTRKWQDPDGKVFGKPNLRMTTKNNFIKMLNGYRHEYISDELEPA